MRVCVAKTVIVVTLMVLGPVILIAADAPSDSPAIGDERINFVHEQMKRVRLASQRDPEQPFVISDNVCMRWSNPVSGVVDGGVFVWMDNGRPVLVSKAYVNEREPYWAELFQSVATEPLELAVGGKVIWTPRNDLVFHNVPDLKGPKEVPKAARMSQMRALARRLSITCMWSLASPTPWELRMLTAPIVRYSSQKAGVLDGAIFAFTQGGTNPEAIAIVECIEKDGEAAWRVAVLRLTRFAITAKFDDVTITDVPKSNGEERTESFHRQSHALNPYPFKKVLQ